ncbi:MAG: cell division protein FtsQ/DivIB [Myxococcota bacterium]
MSIRVKKRERRYHRSRLKSFLGIAYKNLIYLVILIFVVATGFGIKKIYHFVMTSDFFAVKRINVFGTRNSFVDDIVGLSGISIGDNIFSFSSTKTAEQIKSHPWVKKVLVRKHLPDGVSIEITEYRPVMFINFSQLYLVDENAVVFKRLEAGEIFDFPIISGISKDDYINRTEYFRQKILSIFEIENRFSKLFPQIPISEIVYEKDGDITIISARNSFEIRLGQNNYEKKFTILSTILSEVKRSDISPEIVYLDINREGLYTMKLKQRR